MGLYISVRFQPEIKSHLSPLVFLGMGCLPWDKPLVLLELLGGQCGIVGSEFMLTVNSCFKAHLGRDRWVDAEKAEREEV